MNIRDRLTQLTRYRSNNDADGRIHNRRKPAISVSLEELLPGEEISNDHGCFFCTHFFHPGSLRHGCYVLRDIVTVDTGLLSILAGHPSIEECNIQEGAFLDTETTGLSGGTGTLPFLIGLGWFEKNGFVIHQVFIRDYDEEKAALKQVAAFLEDKKFLVTFNGKAFDVNILNTRFILNRLTPFLEDIPHADLLYPARRLFKHRLNDRSLSALEQKILGLTREGDIPGSEIPFLYFDWLRKRDARIMARVFEHNRLDILSLVTLAAKLTELVNPEVMTAEIEPGDKFAAGCIWKDRGILPNAIHVLEAIRKSSRDPSVWNMASRELSLIYRRLGQWQEAISVWEDMIARDPDDIFALIELAKYYEHQAHNPKMAFIYASKARAADPFSPEINHRLERLSRRLWRG